MAARLKLTFLGSLWCVLFHARYTSQRTADGSDWCRSYCAKCDVSWPE